MTSIYIFFNFLYSLLTAVSVYASMHLQDNWHPCIIKTYFTVLIGYTLTQGSWNTPGSHCRLAVCPSTLLLGQILQWAKTLPTYSPRILFFYVVARAMSEHFSSYSLRKLCKWTFGINIVLWEQITPFITGYKCKFSCEQLYDLWSHP